MSYTPTLWATGDTITAEKLNKIEDGIVGVGAGLFVIHATGVANSLNRQTQPTFDKTYAEVLSAFNSGLIPTVQFSVGDQSVYAMFVGKSEQQGFLFAWSLNGPSDSNWWVSRSSIVLGDNGLTMSLYEEAYLATVT